MFVYAFTVAFYPGNVFYFVFGLLAFVAIEELSRKSGRLMRTITLTAAIASAFAGTYVVVEHTGRSYAVRRLNELPLVRLELKDGKPMPLQLRLASESGRSRLLVDTASNLFIVVGSAADLSTFEIQKSEVDVFEIHVSH